LTVIVPLEQLGLVGAVAVAFDGAIVVATWCNPVGCVECDGADEDDDDGADEQPATLSPTPTRRASRHTVMAPIY
jgi:hypothetical protein